MVKFKLTVEEQRLQVQNHNGTEDMQTWQEYRNRRLEVRAGTKVACVRWKVRGAHNSVRLSQQSQAIEAAVKIYEERWGLVDWWMAEVTCAHVTNCILVTVSVSP